MKDFRIGKTKLVNLVQSSKLSLPFFVFDLLYNSIHCRKLIRCLLLLSTEMQIIVYGGILG